MVIDHALGIAGGAGGVEQRQRVPLVLRQAPGKIRIAAGEEGLVIRLAEPFAEKLGHAGGRPPRGDAARFEHEDAPVDQVEQVQRHARGLACAGRSGEQEAVAGHKCAGDLAEGGLDRQVSAQGHGRGLARF